MAGIVGFAAVPIPELSVVCVAGEQRRRVRRCLDAVGAQTAADRIELVVVDVAEGAEAIALPRDLASARVVSAPGSSLGRARAMGARATDGEIVAFLVDHGYPAEGWAQGLIGAYADRWAAVGYAFAPANPGAKAAQTAMLAQFLPWLSPARAGAVVTLPGNMVSYRAEVLRSFDGDLDRLLEIDHLLHERIRAQGREMAVEPDAVVDDECFESIADVALANHVYSEMLAVVRAEGNGWPRLRRVAYALGSPVGVSVVRLARTFGAARRSGRLLALGRALPGVIAIVVMAALGEARGYLGSSRDLGRRFMWRELHAPRSNW